MRRELRVVLARAALDRLTDAGRAATGALMGICLLVRLKFVRCQGER